MILIKGFLRKKTTKIYITIFSIIFVAICLLFAIKTWYLKILNDYYVDTSIFLVIGEENYYDILKSDNRISKIERIALLTPNYDTDVFGDEVTEKAINKVVDGISTQGIQAIYYKLSWNDFKNITLDKVVIYPNSLRPELNLKGNEIALAVHSSKTDYIENYDSYIASIIGQTIELSDDNNNYQFSIASTYDSNFYEMTVSDEMFNKITENSNQYAYNLIVNDMNDTSKIEAKLKSSTNAELFTCGISNDNFDVEKYTESSILLNNAIKIVIAILSIIFLIVIVNIIKDELKSINSDRLLGYNKKQIKKYLILKLLSLSIITLVISTIISIIAVVIVNQIFNYSIEIFNVVFMLKLYGITIISTLVIGLLSGIGANKYIKKM